MVYLECQQLGIAINKVRTNSRLDTVLVTCRATLKDAVKSHTIHTGIDTSYEEFQEQLSSKANEDTQNIKEHSK